MNRYEAIMEKSFEELAELIGIKAKRNCDGNCYCCIKEHFESEDDEE